MIRLTRPDLSGAMDCIKEVLESGYLVQGRNVERFESVVADYVGRRHAVAVNSGTSAIQCALMAAGIGAGDEVILPAFTFPASANAVVACGATPVLADIDQDTFNIKARSITALLSPRTKAVMPVDLFGLASDLETIEEMCKAQGVLLIEDSACALGASLRGRRCGCFGAASILSFHPRKLVTTGEGGMVLTDSDDVAGRARLLRNHGMQRTQGGVEFVLPGYNFRMGELQACLGIRQMSHLDEMIDSRRRIAATYGELLSGNGRVSTPTEPPGAFHTYQSYVIMIDDALDRDDLIKKMKSKGIETAIGTYALPVQPYYRDRFGYDPGTFPESYRAFRHSLSLPIYASMGEETVGRVAAALAECLGLPAAGK